MTAVYMRGYKGYDIEIPMHSATHKSDVNLAQKNQKHLSNASRKN